MNKLYTTINEFKQYLLVKESVSMKDWNRMLDLYLAGNEGAGVASTIKNKDKAIARYVAGIKLAGENVDPSPWSTRSFAKFKERALELGATIEEIQEIFNNTEIPQSILDKEKSLKNKKLDNWTVGGVSKAVLKYGADINYIKQGRALTYGGRDAMMNSGRIWTIGYITELIVNGEKYQFDFDVITNEGVDNNTVYFILADTTDKKIKNVFKQSNSKMGIREFSKYIKEAIEALNV